MKKAVITLTSNVLDIHREDTITLLNDSKEE